MSTEPGNKDVECPRYRWRAEFLAGPGGFASKEEISGDWFNTKAEAVNDANKNADNEVQEFPFARNILKLFVEDENGKEMVELRGKSREHWYDIDIFSIIFLLMLSCFIMWLRWAFFWSHVAWLVMA